VGKRWSAVPRSHLSALRGVSDCVGFPFFTIAREWEAGTAGEADKRTKQMSHQNVCPSFSLFSCERNCTTLPTNRDEAIFLVLNGK
jgi:hypothetical protein